MQEQNSLSSIEQAMLVVTLNQDNIDDNQVAECFIDMIRRQCQIFDDNGPISLAAINSNRQLVISGTKKALKIWWARLLTQKLLSEQVTIRWLPKVHVAFHSPLMDQAAKSFYECSALILKEGQATRPIYPVIGNLTAEPVLRVVLPFHHDLFLCRSIIPICK